MPQTYKKSGEVLQFLPTAWIDVFQSTQHFRHSTSGGQWWHSVTCNLNFHSHSSSFFHKHGSIFLEICITVLYYLVFHKTMCKNFALAYCHCSMLKDIIIKNPILLSTIFISEPLSSSALYISGALLKALHILVQAVLTTTP